MNSFIDWLIAGTILVIALRLLWSVFRGPESILFWTPAAMVHRRYGVRTLRWFLILVAIALALLSIGILRRGRALPFGVLGIRYPIWAALPS